jgi:hypothetical protein
MFSLYIKINASKYTLKCVKIFSLFVVMIDVILIVRRFE